ncbi:Ltp family lipoprotein [Bifidobacterium sp. SO1]|uniref:Ltp family lipoprotein n=1 Tax=Bifidobacterium sp. SO1 TaxID=2809029 RepID=UPI001BDBBB35|nr:Ltp family lipoprotein [Bifidobacterium sp. SO1]MBT1162305.1 Ltp family lipoprotein [Bifidobacterium sp. SO1]
MSAPNVQQPPVHSQQSTQKPGKKPIWKRLWFWIVAVIVVIAISASMNGNSGNGSQSGTPQSSTGQSQQSDSAKSDTVDQPDDTSKQEEETKVPTEYKSALKQADTYANVMHMSKQGVYDQLVSEYGGKFSAEAAQYAIDNVKADWNANALAKAKSYQNDMAMSPEAIRDQLTSEYGEKFTADEANYAIDHLND